MHLASACSILHTHGCESDFESRKTLTFSERANLYLAVLLHWVFLWKLFFFLYFNSIMLPLA